MAGWLKLLYPGSSQPAPVRPSLTLFFWLVGSFVLTLLPHVSQFPVWVSVVIIGAMIVRSFLEYYRMPLPSNGFTALIALCFLVAIFLQYHTVAGREAGTAFMAGLMAIKFYELRGPRDVAVVIFCSLFVVMSALLYSQALELFIYCIIMMWVLTGSLVRTGMGDYPDNHLLQMLGVSGRLYLQALPLAVFLFFFMPRYSGKLQLHLSDSPLGLTDQVAPGSIAKLADDDSPAMNVKFLSGDVPSTDAMYWRAIVLWHYHHGMWTQGYQGAISRTLPAPLPHSTPVVQEITIFPHNQKWLFALDYPVQPPVRAIDPRPWGMTLDGGVMQLGQFEQVDHKDRYTVTSSYFLADQTIWDAEKKAALALPPYDNKDTDQIDPRVRELADQLYAQNPTTLGYIGSVYHFFRKNFTYTTAPGQAQGDWLPYFLFERKAGFCEHFASAFAILMRLEHIPARLVIGYKGADFNPYDNLYTVLQSNAHAWDEVWIEDRKHWVRIDPTAVLPPGADALASSASSNPSDNLATPFTHHHTTFSEKYFPDWLRQAADDLQLRREQIEANWDDWVFSYDPEAQSRLAQWLGFGRNSYLPFLISFPIILGGAIWFFRQRLKWRHPPTPIEAFYVAFCRHMAQRGLPRAMWEGPLAYTDRLAEAVPEQKDAIREAGTLVARYRYGPEPVIAASPRELEELLERLAPA